MDLIKENWDSGYVFNGGIMQDFFSVFAVYFPAGIGILAGANISGDLKVSLLFKNWSLTCEKSDCGYSSF